MRMTSLLAYALTATVIFSSCSKDEEKKIDPSDSNALQSVLVIPNGTLTSGNPPAPSTSPSRPQVNLSQSSGTVISGNQVQIPFSYSSSAGYTNCYVQVTNATNGYFNIPSSTPNVNSGTINIPVTVPANVSSGQFCVIVCIADAQGRVSNQMTFCVSVTAPVTGGGSGVGNGTFNAGGTAYSGFCVATTPSATGTNGTDVVIGTQSGNSFIIYNIPTGTSGSSSFVNGWNNNTGLWGALNISGTSIMATQAGGTVTKTGAKSFTFSCTVYDIITNQQKTVTGSGTWQ